MAKMFPSIPKDFSEASAEGIMFDELSKLPDSYYVFHSFVIVTVKNGKVFESETDFIIFHPDKGILCIEAKNGQVECRNGEWFYGSGKKMKKNGPFEQARLNKWKLSEYMIDHNMSSVLDHCKLMHAVWFPAIRLQKFSGKTLPPDADIRLMLTKDSYGNLEADISRIFDIELPGGIETKLTQNETQRIINEVLAPSFDLISITEMTRDFNAQMFERMLKEQKALINYLDEQNSAVINGMAGTGKTVLAIEKARRNAEKGEQVLFLCYNALLRDHLKEAYPIDNVKYYTIDALACALCKTQTADYSLLRDKLYEYYVENDFPFQHIVIDEGQDFGQERMEDEELISLLKANVVDDDKGGTFYLFYDRNQMIQSRKMPEYISNADCKLTLYRNCRNTENIATTSMRMLGSDKKPRLIDGTIPGELTEVTLTSGVEEVVSRINQIINQNLQDGYKDIVILTCKTESSSCIGKEISGGIYSYNRKKVKFSTCRKFKGLEADVIILVDVDKQMVNEEVSQIMYVGASRAKYRLYVVASINDEDCTDVVQSFGGKKMKKPGKALAAIWNAKYVD